MPPQRRSSQNSDDPHPARPRCEWDARLEYVSSRPVHHKLAATRLVGIPASSLSLFHRSSSLLPPLPLSSPWPWPWPPPGSPLPPHGGAGCPLRALHSQRLSPSTCHGGRRLFVPVPIPSLEGRASSPPPRSSTSPEVPYPKPEVSCFSLLFSPLIVTTRTWEPLIFTRVEYYWRQLQNRYCTLKHLSSPPAITCELFVIKHNHIVVKST